MVRPIEIFRVIGLRPLPLTYFKLRIQDLYTIAREERKQYDYLLKGYSGAPPDKESPIREPAGVGQGFKWSKESNESKDSGLQGKPSKTSGNSNIKGTL
jgi:hypothetical protein